MSEDELKRYSDGIKEAWDAGLPLFTVQENDWGDVGANMAPDTDDRDELLLNAALRRSRSTGTDAVALEQYFVVIERFIRGLMEPEAIEQLTYRSGEYTNYWQRHFRLHEQGFGLLSTADADTLAFTPAEQALGALGIMVALERYQRDHGAYPETLKAFIPDYLAEMPIDPYDLVPFGYERRRRAYRLTGTGASFEHAPRLLLGSSGARALGLGPVGLGRRRWGQGSR